MAVNLCKRSICIWSQHSLCKIPSLALGVKAFIIVIYEASDGAFFVTVAWSLLQVHPGPFPVFPVTFPLLGFAASQASAASSFDQLATTFDYRFSRRGDSA